MLQTVCNIIIVFAVTYDQFNAFKIFNFFQKKKSYWPWTFEKYSMLKQIKAYT